MLKTMEFNNTVFTEIPGLDGKYFISKTGEIISGVYENIKLLNQLELTTVTYQ